MTTKTVALIGLLTIFSTTAGYLITRNANVPDSVNSAQNSTNNLRLSKEKVKRNLLPNQLRWALNQLGDRLERVGKERQTVSGDLRQNGKDVRVQVVSEFPDRIRFLLQDGSSGRAVIFNGNEATAHGPPPNSHERDLIESLVSDSPEHFFISHTRGMPIRSLGNRLRTDDGLHYDVYELTNLVKSVSAPRVRSKRYYFNSNTQLLEKVHYQIERNGATIQVETRFEDWQVFEQQRYATQISRFENGHLIWILSVKSSSTGPSLEDGLFSTP